MSLESLTVRTAKNRLQSFYDETALREKSLEEHVEAMECLDCEAFLQIGIDAFEWIQRVAAQQRRFGAQQQAQLDDCVTLDVNDLFRDWLMSVGLAERWADRHRQRGFTLENYAQLLQCIDQARAVLAESGKLQSLAARVPKAEDLDLIAIDVPDEWHDDPSWSK